MIMTFEGFMGAGKTLTASVLAYLEFLYFGRKIISNYDLKFKHDKIDLAKFVEGVSKTGGESLRDVILLLDEPYSYLDGRTSSSKINRLWTYFVVQTRKRKVDLYIPVHSLEYLDLRLRDHVDVRCFCGFDIETSVCRVTFVENRSGRKRKYEFYAEPFFGIYNTEERVPFSIKVLEGIETKEVGSGVG